MASAAAEVVLVDDDPSVLHDAPMAMHGAASHGEGTGAVMSGRDVLVHCNGPLLASMIHEMTCAKTDCEGLLLGKEVRTSQSVMGDADVATVTHGLTVVIESFRPLGRPMSFYSADGDVHMDKLNDEVSDLQSVVGWFSFRRGTSLTASYRERLVYASLQRLLGAKRTPVLALFTCRYAANAATHTMEHCFVTRSKGHSERVPGDPFVNARFHLANLDHSMHEGYKVMPRTSMSITPSPHTFDYSSIMALLQKACGTAEGSITRHGQHHTTESRLVEESFCEGLRVVERLVNQVAESDARVHELEQKLAAVRPQPPHPTLQPTDLPERRPARSAQSTTTAASAASTPTQGAQGAHQPVSTGADAQGQGRVRTLSAQVAVDFNVTRDVARQMIAAGAIPDTHISHSGSS
eukprot:m.7666 g.7666  ORF g.7666 m.7666 type:complete len:408 (-) comp2466_c0_seq2:123-1346(-)